MIHVARDGAKLGEFTLEQIRAGLTSGQFQPTDLAWQSGMTDWRPLSEFAGATSAPPPAAPPLSVTAAPAAAASGLPWEHRQQLGLVKAWFDTVSLLITRPGDAFMMMRPEGGMLDPLLFGLIGGCAGSVISILFQDLMSSLPVFGANDEIFRSLGLSRLAFTIIYAVLSPLFVTFGLLILSALFHLCLMLVGGANRSFETTFRVVCFTGGSAHLFSVIPVCGGFIALVYSIVLYCIGLSRAHPTTTGKALLAIFLPIIVCCGVCVLLVAVLGGFGALLNRH